MSDWGEKAAEDRAARAKNPIDPHPTHVVVLYRHHRPSEGGDLPSEFEDRRCVYSALGSATVERSVRDALGATSWVMVPEPPPPDLAVNALGWAFEVDPHDPRVNLSKSVRRVGTTVEIAMKSVPR